MLNRVHLRLRLLVARARVHSAGSERVALTGATGQVLQQSIGINKSLFVLRKVIKSLSKLAAATGGDGGGGVDRASKALAHVPYRDSTLTRLLQHSLGGNSVTLMLACLSPSDLYAEENLSTLNYAGLTKRIANSASINEDPQTALIRKLRAEVKLLRGMLARANQTFVLGRGSSPTAAAVAGGGGVALSALRPGAGVGVGASSGSSGSSLSLYPSSLSAQQVAIGEKLVDSVNIIKELVRDNNALRHLYEQHRSETEQLEIQNATLNQENDELRDRVHFLEVRACALSHTHACMQTSSTGGSGAMRLRVRGDFPRARSD